MCALWINSEWSENIYYLEFKTSNLNPNILGSKFVSFEYFGAPYGPQQSLYTGETQHYWVFWNYDIVYKGVFIVWPLNPSN